jgi:hypothetical protein
VPGNNFVGMSNLHTDDTCPLTYDVAVEYDNAEGADMFVRVSCTGLAGSTQQAAPVGGGPLTFTLTHGGEHLDATVTAELFKGATGVVYADDSAESVDFTDNPRIVIAPDVRAPHPPYAPVARDIQNSPAGIYHGSFTPSPGGNKVVVVVFRKRKKRVYKALQVRYATLILAPGNHTWEVPLDGFPAGANGRIVVRAYLLNHADKVRATTTWRP